jgi:hypothetical protein
MPNFVLTVHFWAQRTFEHMVGRQLIRNQWVNRTLCLLLGTEYRAVFGGLPMPAPSEVALR